MLTACRAPRACQICRLQLLSLFENGFATPASSNAARARYSSSISLRPRPRSLRRDSWSVRNFTPSRQLAEEPSVPKVSASAADIEAVVREARQTFGENLPKDYLSIEEYVLYERLYGPPLRETQPEDLEYLPGAEEEVDENQVRNVLLRETAEGEIEEIELDLGISVSYDDIENVAETTDGDPLELGSDVEEANVKALDATALNPFNIAESDALAGENVQVQGKNQREVDAILRLQKDIAAPPARPTEEEEEVEEYEEVEKDIEEDEEDFGDEEEGYISSDTLRTHPHTMNGRSGTFPTTISLPKTEFIDPLTALLERTKIKHISEAAEKAFGGSGFPYSSSTPNSQKHLPQKPVGLDASQHRMSEVEADAYITAVMPGTYAIVMGSLVEVRKRLGTNWLRNLLRKGVGPRILDAGAGGAGLLAWKEVVKSEWDIMCEEGIAQADPPEGKTTVLTGSDTLRNRMSSFLENTTFIPRLPDYVHSSSSESHLDGGTPQPRKSYDIIIAPHSLLPLKEDYRRKNVVQNLWSLLDPKGGVLILIEKGIPRGFEAIAGARSLLLERHIASPGDTMTENEIESPASDHARFADKEEGMIIAPCTNHLKCPLYLKPGLSSGRKDFCHFSQRFIRPEFLQRVLGPSLRNHEDVKYSYLAVRRGVDYRLSKQSLLQGDAATEQSFEGYEEHDLPSPELEDGPASDVKFHAMSLPRAILPPLKRRGHVTLDLCTPSGKLERWTVPKSFSKAAYRDARKSKWGDLWALGAKTRVMRSPRLGRPAEESGKGGKLKGVRDGKMGKGGKKVKKNKFDIVVGKAGFEGIKQDRSQSKFVQREKRTKGGRIWKEKKPITEDDL